MSTQNQIIVHLIRALKELATCDAVRNSKNFQQIAASIMDAEREFNRSRSQGQFSRNNRLG